METRLGGTRVGMRLSFEGGEEEAGQPISVVCSEG